MALPEAGIAWPPNELEAVRNTKEKPMSDTNIPEGYEPAPHSYAKNHAMDALEKELDKQGIELYEDGSPELIELSDAVVEALIRAGVTIPDDITDPHAIR